MLLMTFSMNLLNTKHAHCYIIFSKRYKKETIKLLVANVGQVLVRLALGLGVRVDDALLHVNAVRLVLLQVV